MKEVPKYKVIFEGPESGEFALVIPVINEGDRISSLLRKIKDLKLSNLDVLIIDGGSTDHSSDHVKELGVNTLIVKIGEGKLGAQLRCAYDFCLQRKYRGVITIDGNDKDDPEAIPRFIEKLNKGYDFVQASRFIAGGHEINTPFSRKLAIKFIHAPLLSLSSGFQWTDTTQGFRGYSRRLLESKELDIFRDVFRNYELLFFLSHAAPKHGFKCIELPTKRIYPQGKVPTKISRISGNFSVLKTLIKVVFGEYDKK